MCYGLLLRRIIQENIPTEIRSKEITKDNVQEKLDAFVEAMTK